MADSFAPSGIDLPSPTLSARLRELADFLGAPAAGRLTEEQRALALGVARRLVADAAAELDESIDFDALWRDWLAAGIPGAPRFAAACFARAEEHRWREQSAQRAAAGQRGSAEELSGDAEPAIAAATPADEIERAYLALQIADRKRFDRFGNPSLALADVDADLLRGLLLDIAGWQARRTGKPAAGLDDAANAAIARHDPARGVDRAARAYHDRVGASGGVADVAATAIRRHDWPAFVALAAGATRRSWTDMILGLLSAEPAALPILLAPLRLDHAALAPLEASLAMLPARAVAPGGAHE